MRKKDIKKRTAGNQQTDEAHVVVSTRAKSLRRDLPDFLKLPAHVHRPERSRLQGLVGEDPVA